MMLQNPELFQLIYVGEILGFSLYILTLESWTRAVRIWLITNFFGVVGSIFIAQSYAYSNDTFSVLGAAIGILAGSVKCLCFSSPKIWRRSNWVPNTLAMLAFAIGLAIAVDFDPAYRLILVTLGGIASALSSLLFIYANKRWAGLRPVYFTAAVLMASLVGFLCLLTQAYPIGDHTRIADQGSGGSTSLILLCIFMFLFHMAFIGLITARYHREKLLQMRRFQRVQSAAEQSAKIQQQDAAVADERYHLLKMLTHEVRQPLNTAQAALQTVIDQISQRQTTPERVEQTATKVQSTLNSIVLSISNSILGATLITQGRPTRLDLIDLCDVASLALLDLDPSQRGRIEQRFEQLEIYANADPIVLRLAIRNLLENALKYSPPDSSILFELVTDEEKLASVIRVTNDLIDPSMLTGDIFQLNRRGVDSKYEETGLGLYIVRKVAEMHEGDIGYRTVNGHQVAFELSIPAW